MKVQTEENFQKTIMDEINGLKKALERKYLVAVHAFYLIAYIIRRIDKKFKQIYYSDDGYWRGKLKAQFRNWPKHRAQQKKRPRNGY